MRERKSKANYLKSNRTRTSSSKTNVRGMYRLDGRKEGLASGTTCFWDLNGVATA